MVGVRRFSNSWLPTAELPTHPQWLNGFLAIKQQAEGMRLRLIFFDMGNTRPWAGKARLSLVDYQFFFVV
jgi:hypothetical protein